ncbi:hypothetical protein [Frankia canadensis]|uniref:hypothetical protein n=1 Tax=Frankia canadensis TaxID=1836972 RepID=UPI000C7B3C27|nr:hypothetical protein [Frankia canadensis]
MGRASLDDSHCLPARFVTIKVHQDSPTGFRIEGFEGGARTFGGQPSDGAVVAGYDPRRLRLRVEDLQERYSAIQPVEFIEDFNMWSLGNRRNALRRWLNDLRLRHSDLHVIIEDGTNLAIPWEAFRLQQPPDHGDLPCAGWLGAVLPVTRWTPWFGEYVGPSDLDQTIACEGGAIGYFERGLDSGGADLASLGDFLAGTPHVDENAFVAALGEPVPPGEKRPAMVYVGAHSEAGDDRARTSVGPFRLKTMMLYQDLPRISGGQTIVFVNACNSAEMFTVGHFGDDSLYGLPDFFLRMGAVGMIGTTSAIGVETAPLVLAEILRAAADDPQAPIPQLLSRLRAQADLALGPPPYTNRDIELAWRWIDTFNYVYYGHPLATLRLVSQRVP